MYLEFLRMIILAYANVLRTWRGKRTKKKISLLSLSVSNGICDWKITCFSSTRGWATLPKWKIIVVMHAKCLHVLSYREKRHRSIHSCIYTPDATDKCNLSLKSPCSCFAVEQRVKKRRRKKERQGEGGGRKKRFEISRLDVNTATAVSSSSSSSSWDLPCLWGTLCTYYDTSRGPEYSLGSTAGQFEQQLQQLQLHQRIPQRRLLTCACSVSQRQRRTNGVISPSVTKGLRTFVRDTIVIRELLVDDQSIACSRQTLFSPRERKMITLQQNLLKKYIWT